ncbi:MULE domain-containing protein [Aphis craccivora]|uniref:MULE domain-containing protein n=1 Tax=Aphis craccivora TaxID=307492 RepID=A0A6G0WLB7_APHCR|nr:MULE domain-containing protein [Aphis craccivora]
MIYLKYITTILTPRNLISHAVQTLLTSIIGQLPNIEKNSKTIRRERIKQQKPPANPVNVKDLIVSGEYLVTNKGGMFLFYDNKIQKCILIFSTLENLNTLKECSSWFGDCTFRSVPTLFSQLYTIHGTKSKQCFPLVYILMVDRSKDSYIEVLKMFKSLISNLTP